MSFLWHDIWLYPSFKRVDEGKWSLFDFVNLPRNVALRSADRVIGEQEPDVLKIHLEQFLLPAMPADPTTYISQPPPSGGSGVSAAKTKKPTRVKITRRKVMTAGATTAPVAVSISVVLEGATAVSAPTSVVSPPRAQKKHMILPSLNSFQAIEATHALPAGSFAEAQVEGVSSVPLTTGDAMSSAAGGPSLSDLISQASVAAVSSSMLPPVFTTTVVVTPSPVSTQLFSSATPMSLFDSPIGVFSTSEREMPTASVACESTSARDTAISDAGDLAAVLVMMGPDKRYQPNWKIAESSRLIFPPVVHHWVERAYPPAESAYVEGLNNENLMNASMVDVVGQPRKLAKIWRWWMHDNNELHQARVTIQELMDEKYRLENQLQAAGLRESRFISKKNKAEEDLKRVTANLAKERIFRPAT
ncbi:hypothetical protein Hanom_Chr05g00398471 [Helianthus anomalus]